MLDYAVKLTRDPGGMTSADTDPSPHTRPAGTTCGDPPTREGPPA